MAKVIGVITDKLTYRKWQKYVNNLIQYFMKQKSYGILLYT